MKTVEWAGCPKSARRCPKWFCGSRPFRAARSQSTQSSPDSQIIKTVEWAGCPKCGLVIIQPESCDKTAGEISGRKFLKVFLCGIRGFCRSGYIRSKTAKYRNEDGNRTAQTKN